ncbi:MAG: quinolinate synthase NadA [Acidobacteriota bacterium]
MSVVQIEGLPPGLGRCKLPDEYFALSDPEIMDRIAELKAELGRRLVILGHHYQRDEVVQFADFRGDSLRLSQLAAERSEADYIVFCGVHFMAESADILCAPHQTVILPDMRAGCSMADMADIDQVEECWEALEQAGCDQVIPVTYMNSTAAIKAFCGEHGGACCTSSNAAAILRWAYQRGKQVLFLPDEHLGRNTGYAMGIPLDTMAVWDPFEQDGGNSVERLRQSPLLLWKGYCSVHARFSPEQVTAIRAQVPGIRVIVHPECRREVVELADEYGSTEKIIQRVASSPVGSSWAVGTEIHLVNRLMKEYPDRAIYTLDPTGCLCATMFRIAPPHLLWTLENLSEGRVVNTIRVAPDVKRWARVALDRMLEIR